VQRTLFSQAYTTLKAARLAVVCAKLTGVDATMCSPESEAMRPGAWRQEDRACEEKRAEVESAGANPDANASVPPAIASTAAPATATDFGMLGRLPDAT